MHRKQLVLGFANAWAGVGKPVKALYLTPMDIRDAYESLLSLSLQPRSLPPSRPPFRPPSPHHSRSARARCQLTIEDGLHSTTEETWFITVRDSEETLCVHARYSVNVTNALTDGC